MDKFSNLVELIIKNGKLVKNKMGNDIIFNTKKFAFKYVDDTNTIEMLDKVLNKITLINSWNSTLIELTTTLIEEDISLKKFKKIQMKDKYNLLENIIKENGGEIEGEKYFIKATENTIYIVDKEEEYDLFYFVKDSFFIDSLSELEQAEKILRKTLEEKICEN